MIKKSAQARIFSKVNEVEKIREDEKKFLAAAKLPSDLSEQARRDFDIKRKEILVAYSQLKPSLEFAEIK